MADPGEPMSAQVKGLASQKQIEHESPDGGWCRVETPVTLKKALMAMPSSTWPLLWDVVAAIREEYRW